MPSPRIDRMVPTKSNRVVCAGLASTIRRASVRITTATTTSPTNTHRHEA